MSKVILAEDSTLINKSSLLLGQPGPGVYDLLMTIAINALRKPEVLLPGALKDVTELFNTERWGKEGSIPLASLPPSITSVSGAEFSINTKETIFEDGDYEKIVDIIPIDDLMGDFGFNRSEGAFAGVYILTFSNKPISYIGSSVNVFKRLREHRNNLAGDRHYNKRLQTFYNLHKDDPVVRIKVQVIRTAETQTPFWLENETLSYVKRKQAVFNIGDTAELPKLGVSVSEETRSRMSESALGKKLSKVTRDKMAAVRKGKVNSEEHVLKTTKALSKEIMGDGIKYPSASAAGRILGINQSTITRRLSSKGYPGWYLIGSEHDPDVKSGKIEQTTEKNADNLGYRIDGKIYFTSTEAGNELGYSSSTVKRRADDPRFPTWERIEINDPARLVRSTSKAVVVDGEHFLSLRIAADSLGVHPRTIIDWMNHPVNHPNTYYVGSDKDPLIKK
ncbi:I-TevI-like homing endonuclease [Serratia phage BUCT660]|nr:I-TevI-like homing endonuclease [Serratia phage BUCT660]